MQVLDDSSNGSKSSPSQEHLSIDAGVDVQPLPDPEGAALGVEILVEARGGGQNRRPVRHDLFCSLRMPERNNVTAK